MPIRSIPPIVEDRPGPAVVSKFNTSVGVIIGVACMDLRNKEKNPIHSMPYSLKITEVMTKIKHIKKWLPSMLVLSMSLIWAACDSTVAPDTTALTTTTIDNEEVAALNTALVADLNLSSSEAQQMAQVMSDNSDRAHGPGFLWAVAAELQKKLTDEQKRKLYSVADRLGESAGLLCTGGFHSPPGIGGPRLQNNAGDFRSPPDILGDGFFNGLFNDLLSDEQKAAIEDIRAKYSPQIRDLIEAAHSGQITREAFMEEMKAIHASIHAEIEALLTEDQKAEIARRIAEKRAELENRRAAYREQAVAAMKEALALTSEQEASFDELCDRIRSDVDELLAQFHDGSLTREEMLDALSALKEGERTAVEELLDETQWEIVLIHDALSIRSRHLPMRGNMGNGTDHSGNPSNGRGRSGNPAGTTAG